MDEKEEILVDMCGAVRNLLTALSNEDSSSEMSSAASVATEMFRLGLLSTLPGFLPKVIYYCIFNVEIALTVNFTSDNSSGRNGNQKEEGFRC